MCVCVCECVPLRFLNHNNSLFFVFVSLFFLPLFFSLHLGIRFLSRFFSRRLGGLYFKPILSAFHAVASIRPSFISNSTVILGSSALLHLTPRSLGAARYCTLTSHHLEFHPHHPAFRHSPKSVQLGSSSTRISTKARSSCSRTPFHAVFSTSTNNHQTDRLPKTTTPGRARPDTRKTLQ